MSTGVALLLASALLALGLLTPRDEPPADPPATAATSAPPMPPMPATPPADETARTLLDAVLADAARRGDAAAQLVAFEAVTWPDGSLGCPQPDRVYTQALVPGYRIVVRAGDAEHHYHASRRGQWVWCPQARRGKPAGSAA